MKMVNKTRFKHGARPNIGCHLVSFLFSIQILGGKYQKYQVLKKINNIECKSKNSNHEEIATASYLVLHCISLPHLSSFTMGSILEEKVFVMFMIPQLKLDFTVS